MELDIVSFFCDWIGRIIPLECMQMRFMQTAMLVVCNHQLRKVPLLAETVEQFAAHHSALEVDSGRRFIKNQQFRILRKRAGKHHSLQFSARKRSERTVCQLSAARLLQQSKKLRLQRFADAEAERALLVERRHEFEHGQRHSAVKRERLRDIPEARTLRIVSVETDGSGVGNLIQQSQNKRCFSRPVRTNDGCAPSPRNGCADVRKNRHSVIFDGYMFETYRVRTVWTELVSHFL